MATQTLAFSAPSNIALIKYWGKGINQTPKNPSLSFSLKNAVTKTSLDFLKKEEGQAAFTFSFEGKSERKFHPKIESLFASAFELYPTLADYSFQLQSENTFPHSTGIASSASSMAALSLCLTSLAKNLHLPLVTGEFLSSASFLARLGSGSAARSTYGGFTIWGRTRHYPQASDEYAIDVNEMVHSSMKKLGDSILIVSSKEKTLGSSAGHRLMNDNPYANTRFLQADVLMGELLSSMKTGDFEKWGEIVEKEALGLHALMLLSESSPILLKPASLELITLIREFRKESSLPVYFTIDAGPNIHLLYPLEIKSKVQQFITDRCLKHLENAMVIHDEIGPGPYSL
ncbi:MAG: diphosphomevalonate/mevalonate 3,5-bisphosphate decarboxylase family protein [Bacteriovoracaceae bacterium]